MAVSLPSEGPCARIPVRPAAGGVALWLIDLDASPDGVRALLSPGERARGARIVCPRRRLRWERSRGSLRDLLARRLEADPTELELMPGPHGKPALAPAGGEGGPGRRPLRFSLSHSHGLMLVAMSERGEVGVDIERRRARRAEARRTEARRAGTRRTGTRRTAEFLRAWTVREATVKCLGVGLAAGGRPAPGGTLAGARRARAGVWTTELDVGAEAFAALALASPCASRRPESLLREPALGVGLV